jgi:DNA-binding transcriptional regulator YhcF (GntR family)
MVTIDRSSPTPPFEQVRRQLAAQISAGTLPVGARLPPVRALACDLGVAANTVARVYRELEAAGLVTTRGRAGTAVAAGTDERRARLLDAAQAYARLVRETGTDPQQAVTIVQAALTTSEGLTALA